MKHLTVLSLFDGISCGRVALQRANIPVAKYYASEIDKYAIQVTQKNWPDTIQLGDVKNVWARNLPKIDLLIGGSPCQDLSIAKVGRKGLDGERSGLFWHYVRLLRTCKPKYFLLENVASMSKDNERKITEVLGVEPIMINSALVSAQQRKRLYWTNIPNITQPEDKGLVLADILENGLPYEEKAKALTVSYTGAVIKDSLEKKRKTMIFNPYNNKINTEKSAPLGTNPQCQTSKCGQVVIKPMRLGGLYGQITRWGCYAKEGKAPTLTASMGMGGGFVPMVPIQLVGGGQAQRIYDVKGKTICLSANGGGGAKTGLYKIDLPDGQYTVRKLTPVECERLQTLPDNYSAGISNTQRYKCIGNGWTVDVIAHIFSFIPKEDK